ncbi:MAG: hypothetical protein J6W80_03790 [Kiritimatiellae bacterium]|nr:hypothetical protein [Kiritimatiellia bacterium]
MKCELCQKNEAQSAINLEKDGEEQELYVCNECARKEKAKRQIKRARMRKTTALPGGVEMSITEFSLPGGEDGAEDGAPPIVKAIIDAVHGMVSDLAKANEERKKRVKAPPEKKELNLTRAVHPAFRINGRMHLEGIFLIGELNQVKNAFDDLGLELRDVSGDDMRDLAHAYTVLHPGDEGLAKRAVQALLDQERNARVRLVDEMPRVLADCAFRSLATLKNCRLMTEMELFDLLATLRLVAAENMLDGITLAQLDSMLKEIDTSFPETKLCGEDRDRAEAALADAMNERFEDVVLNERAERILGL